MTATSGESAFIRVEGTGFAIGAKPLPYVHGINYEGPANQAWHMWDVSTFSPTLIAADFDRAVHAGYGLVRIFVQGPLTSEILSGDFAELDTVIALAKARGIYLLLTLNDDHNPDLTQVARVDRLIAAHVADEPIIFGYDIENEPGLSQIAADLYPLNVIVPLQGIGVATLLARYSTPSEPQVRLLQGGRAGPLKGTQGADPSLGFLSGSLTVSKLLASFLVENPQFPLTPVSELWQPFVAACDESLSAFLTVQVGAIRSVDPYHLITVGYNSPFWASLPANSLLDFRSIHLYPNPTYAGMSKTLRIIKDVRALSSTPLVLEEYGFPSAEQTAQSTAIDEMALELAAREAGSAGALKWMLNDVPNGANPREDTLGVFDTSANPKPIYFASQAVSSYFATSTRGGQVTLSPDATSGVAFRYTASDGFATSSATYSGDDLTYQEASGEPGQVWISWAQPGYLHLMSTQVATITLNLSALTRTGALSALSTVPPDIAWAMQRGWVIVHTRPGVNVTVHYQSVVRPVPPVQQGWQTHRASGAAVATPILNEFLLQYRNYTFGTITILALRLRAGPGLHARQIGIVTEHTTLALVGTSGRWLHVVTPLKASGWVYGAYVSRLSSASKAPAVIAGSHVSTPQKISGTPVTPRRVAASITRVPQTISRKSPVPTVARKQGRPTAITTSLTPVKHPHAIRIQLLGRLAQITADGVHVRQKPSLHAPILFVAYHGSMVAVRQIHSSWVRATFTNGVTGWIYRPYLRMQAQRPRSGPLIAGGAAMGRLASGSSRPSLTSRRTASHTMPNRSTTPTIIPYRLSYVWATTLHVRTAPRLSGKVVALMGQNTVVHVLGVHISWSHVVLPNGTVGWVLTHYIKRSPKMS